MKSSLRIAALAGVLLSCAGPRAVPPVTASRPSDPDPRLVAVDAALARGVRFLLAAQSADGAWRSEAYAALRDGAGTTPLVLLALAHAAPAPGLEAAWARGAAFVAGLADLPPTAYPTYAPALAVLALSLPGGAPHRRARDVHLARLRDRQLVEAHGWSPEDVSYGGWADGFGPVDRAPAFGRPPAANLSATLFALGALAMAEVPLEDPAWSAARRFVARCQGLGPELGTDAGGFFLSVEDASRNKAGHLELGEGRLGRARGYGTATADGLRAWLRLGGSRRDPEAVAAAAWLRARFSAERVPGDFPEDRRAEQASLYYYWTWTAAHVALALGELDWARALADALVARQQGDGAWRNPATVLFEDEALVATPMALAGLAVARLLLTGEARPQAGAVETDDPS